MVHEFVKTITQFFNDELSLSVIAETNAAKLKGVVQFLNSSNHVT